MRKHHQFLVSVLLVIVTAARPATGADCRNVQTSEGLVTLPDGQFACANGSPDDLGKNYLQCVHGHVYTRPCPGNLRWDTTINGCNFPGSSSCALTDRNLDLAIPDEQTTTSSPRTTRQTDRTTARTTSTTERIPTEDTTSGIVRTTRLRRTRTTDKTTTTQEEIPSTTTTLKTNRTTQTTTTSQTPTIQSSRTTRGRVTVNVTTTTKKIPVSSTPPHVYDTTTVVRSTDYCVHVDTSEGPRTLQHGQKACAALGGDEDESELGRRFVTCSSGTVYIQECQTGLRYDTTVGLCNWPDAATCQLEGESPPDDDFSQTRSTSKSSSGSGQPTRATNPPRSTRCNTNDCKLPDCFCFGDSPSSIPLEKMPLLVMLTFDDAVTSTLYNSYYRALAVDNDYSLFNPNGCRVRSTFYVSHENTDYSHVQAIWNSGNEIGSHTIHHNLPTGNSDSDYPQMVAEIQGLKDKMLEATGDRSLVDSIVGFRAPYLRVAGDVQFDVLHDYNFLYDTSILNINNLQGKKPHWPYTLDYIIGECINPPCPKKSYPGLWEVPLNGWIGDDKQGCSMVDSCVVGKNTWTATEQEWYNFYDRNFQDYFYANKVPMPIFTHGFLYANYPNSYSAMTSWFQDLLLTHDDVWIVTPTQVIDWMKNPISNEEMIAQKWGC